MLASLPPKRFMVTATNLPTAVTVVIHFWLPLLTQPVTATMAGYGSYYYNNYYNYNEAAASNILPTIVAHTEFDAHEKLFQIFPPPSSLPSPSPPSTLMDKILTHRDSSGSSGSSKDNTKWQPVCATTDNSVDYVLFSSEYLLWQTNRMRRQQNLDTGETEPVFRKIAMGLCRPNCSDVIYESDEEPICAQNLRNNEVRVFSGPSEMARDVCIHDNEWLPLFDATCTIKSDDLSLASAISNTPQIASPSKAPTSPITPTATTTATTSKIVSNSKQTTSNLPKKQTKKIGRKSVPCPKVFNPVCAELFGVKVTFINECLVNAENVKLGKNWKIFSKGVCAEDYASSDTYKGVISKRSVFDTHPLTYQMNASAVDLNENVLWKSNNANIMDFYEREKYSYTRIFPDIDDRVAVCKFGIGPVCGRSPTQGVHHFGNVCEMMLRNFILNETWSVIDENQCIGQRCILNCTSTYNPICISLNGINYTMTNQCHVDYDFCRYKESNMKILGKGECKNVLAETEETEKEDDKASSNSNEEYFQRHVRKILESSAEQIDKQSLSSSVDQNSFMKVVTESIELLIRRKATMRPLDESSFEDDSKEPLDHTTTTTISNEDDVSESHIMYLWRSSKGKSFT